MFFSKISCWARACALALVMAAVAPIEAARPLENRLVALDAKPSADIIAFDLPGKQDPLAHGYALELATGSDVEPSATLNGEPIEFDWLRSDYGWIVRVPSWLLKGTGNQLQLAGDALADSTRVQVFSLDGSAEEVHFGRAFAERAALLKAQPAPHPTQPKVDALHYDLAITLDIQASVTPAGTSVAGVLTFQGRVLEGPLNQFALDLHPNGGAMTVSSVDTGPSTAQLTRAFSGNFLVIDLPRSYATGEEFSLRVTYGGTPSTGGVFGAPYRRTTHNGTPIIFTFSEPYGARNWWPCKDLPDDKATIDLRVRCAKPYTVVTNGTLTQREDLGTEEIWHYTAPFPVATYLVAICATNYQYASTVYTGLDGTASMEVGHYLLPENFASEEQGRFGTLDVLEFFAERFGEYPFLDHKYVTVTHMNPSGMEHTTCTSMPAGDVGVATGSSIPGRGRRNVHELAHHWFGNSPTCRTFDHLWLNEGLATWCEALYYEKDGGIAAYHSYIAGLVSSGINQTTPLVSPTADGFAGSLAYRRGGLVMHMLRNVVGTDELYAAIRFYLERHAYGTVVTADFEQAIEDHTGLDLTYFFEDWCYGIGRPAYDWSYSVGADDAGNFLSVRIRQTQASPMLQVFRMPIDLVVTDLSGTRQTFRVFNDQRDQTLRVDIGTMIPLQVQFDPENWILKTVTASNQTARPTITSVRQTSSTSATVTWTASEGSNFEVLGSNDGGTTWFVAATAGATTSATIATSGSADTWVRIRATATGKLPSEFTNTHAVRSASGPRALVVEGYDRWATQGRGATHSFAAWTGQSIGAGGVAYDCAVNELIESGAVALADYDAVLWVLGEESTDTETFSAAEQLLVKSYLDAGGNLFVSGAEVGWDLGRNVAAVTAADRAFYNNYLKATYASDDANLYSVTGATGGVFEGLSFSYDDGTAGIYRAEYPDEMNPANGSTAALFYATDREAGIQFEGPFLIAGPNGRLVYVGFGFETIHPAETRHQVMARILSHFQLETVPVSVDQFIIY